MKKLRNLLGFTRKEMNGILVMLPLLVFFIVTPSIYTAYFSESYNSFEDKTLLDSLMLSFKSEPELPEKRLRFSFDPNEISKDSLLMLGFPEYLASRILNYRDAGGRFKNKQALKKIYGFPDSLYASVESLIVITKSKVITNRREATVQKVVAESPAKKVEVRKSEVPAKAFPVMIKVNSADTSEWKKLRGIGSVYAKRIVKYKDLLGGFNDLNQISEVYGIKDSLFNSFRGQLVLDAVELKKLKINLATFKEMNAHPYISYEQTKDIFNSKSRIGKYKSALDLLKLSTFDSTGIARIAPYLDFQ